ncbi:MAG: penicillin-binding transpeptidase domain-containing protein [Planctomycetota bacterium]|jgi:penicillin-binding protein 2
MYDKRIKIFVIFSGALLLICLLRLVQMQLVDDSKYREKITELKRQQSNSRQLKTIRGRILDRKGEILACDEPQFHLHINYRLSRFMDSRVRRTKILRAAKNNTESAIDDVQKELDAQSEVLEQVVEKCTQFGLERGEVESKIETINNRIWNLRTFLAWLRNEPSGEILEKYNHKVNSIPLSEAIADFEKKVRKKDERLLRAAEVDDITDIDKSWSLLELKTDDDIFAAQLEFMDIEGVSILPEARRVYPFGSSGAQTIGWVGPATEQYRLPSSDQLSRYLSTEVCGREHVEYVCEAILRGKRGELVYDIDRKLVNRTETRFGKDVSLTLDIKLQQRIEEYLVDSGLNPNNYRAPTAAVVIEVATGDILALVSVPVFDLNRIRYDYGDIESDPNEPLRNRTIYEQYPPGSVIKPVILVAGLQAGEISPDEIISCPARSAPRNWPDCWLYNRNPGVGHDILFGEQGGNRARNAIKGSCNIYFTRLADRLAPAVLQQWLLDFGCGQQILPPPVAAAKSKYKRNLRQVQGQVSSDNKTGTISLEERRYFGMGQGNLRVTVLQVANAMAVLARNGLYKPPRLFIDEGGDSKFNSVALDISQQTLEVVRDGMHAVVNEAGGTAYNEFSQAGFAEQGVKVYGKTGSTEAPEHAWFAGFAEDNKNRSIAIAVVVEGGQHGSSDAGPLAANIIQFCIEAGYIGQSEVVRE